MTPSPTGRGATPGISMQARIEADKRDALAALRSGDVGKAEAPALRAVQAAPQDVSARALASVVRVLQAQAAERTDTLAATALAREALHYDGTRVEAHELLCRLLAASDKAAAARHALAAWRLRPDENSAGNVWQLFTHMGEGAGDLAALAAAADDPGDVTAAVAFANALRRAGRPLAAERRYRRAAALDPGLTFIYSRLACLCVEQGRLAAADRLFRRAATGHACRDVVTRVAPTFMDSLRAAAAAPPPPVRMTEGARVAGAPLIVYISCDSGYFRTFVPSMLRSLFDNAQLDCAVVVHVINPDADLDIAATIAPFGAENFAVLQEQVDLAPFGSQAKTYYACSRFLQLPDLLARWRRPMLLLDVDLMAIRPLGPLLADAGEADVAMMSHALKRLDVWSLTYADVVRILPTDRAQDYFDLVRRYITAFLHPGSAHWFLDQAAMAAARLAGYADRAGPAFVWFPEDMHSTQLMVSAEGDYWTDDEAYFYSVRASAGGARAIARALRRAGLMSELKTATQAADAGSLDRARGLGQGD